MFVFKAAVVGAGVMGGEIAQVIASAGVPVVLKDVDGRFVDAGLQKARAVTEGQVAKLVEKGKLTREQADEQRDSVLRLITPATAYDEFGDVDFVVEAVPEKMAVKHAVFAELDSVTPGHAILSSNTSGLSITEIGDAVYRPDKVVGFHFFWPAARMRLIEIVEGDETSPETMQVASNFAQAIRKTPIRCAEAPGFVVNRILTSTASEIWRYQDETGTPIEAIDEALTARAWLPWARSASRTCPVSTRRSRSRRTCATLTATASTSTAAWRTWWPKGTSAPRAERASMSTREPAAPAVEETLADRFLLKAFVEACLVLEEGIAGVRDIDLGMMMGTGMVPGPFARADFRGLDQVLARSSSVGGRGGRPSSPRSCCGAWSRKAGSGRRAARASTPTRSRTRATRRRPSSSTPAGRSPSSGSTTRRPTRSRRRSSRG
jgi:3-hydroxyacyl-CoA dehydrogenase